MGQGLERALGLQVDMPRWRWRGRRACWRWRGRRKPGGAEPLLVRATVRARVRVRVSVRVRVRVRLKGQGQG